ncbi:heme-binding protein 1 isoform X3 [Physeter macrocephalus]|uniref:Heme-binding protein 1 n=1 Tax=Physeter macrocephalus TaxID=9755 RepID=A0A455BSK3_PHYMC|nr:heme-binding protein 1 isoform X3 [Physeter catodon]|eukprot:XP_028346841.1 heme-binding protein 1 isoform X3 [Physeter catodon]
MLGVIKNSLFGSVETWPWQILSKGDKGEVSYEERACEGGKFATVEVTDKPVDEALREAMPKVVKYVGGTNDKGIGMGMTVPISFAVFPSADGSLQKKLKVWFRIPSEFQSNPPAPSDDSIKIEDREGITVYSIPKAQDRSHYFPLLFGSGCGPRLTLPEARPRFGTQPKAVWRLCQGN